MTVMTNYEKHNRDLEKWEAAKRDLSTELQKANREIERLERVAELAKREAAQSRWALKDAIPEKLVLRSRLRKLRAAKPTL